MAISNNARGSQPGVCTFSTRPTAPYEGQMIYETDTDNMYVWSGTAWVLLPPTASPTFTGVPAAPTAAAGTNTTQLATTAFVTALGAAWTSYTPVITQGVTLTKTVGYAKYTQINKLVICHVTCTITSAGTINQVLTSTLPLTAAYSDAPYFGCNGTATFYDASTATPYVLGVHSAAGYITFVGIAAGGNYWGAIPAVTAANTDVLSFIISYETT